MLRLFVFISLCIIFVQVHAQSPPAFTDKYSKRLGNLRLSSTRFEIGRISNKEIGYDTIYIINVGRKPIRFEVATSLPFVKIILKNVILNPGKESFITAVFDAARKNDYGFVMDRIQLHTDDTLMQDKFLTVSATIFDYVIPSLSSDSKQVNTRVTQSSFTYGAIKQSSKVSHDFIIGNDGTKPLVLHKTKTDCPCVKALLSKQEIAGGDSAIVHVDLDASGKFGPLSVKIFVYTNDPLRPEISLQMGGTILRP